MIELNEKSFDRTQTQIEIFFAVMTQITKLSMLTVLPWLLRLALKLQ